MFQSGFTANAGTVAAILDKEDVDRERPTEPRVDHRRRECSRAPRSRCSSTRTPTTPTRSCAETQGRRPAAAADHRRRVLDGRRHRAAPGARRGRRAARGDHDDRRRARVAACSGTGGAGTVDHFGLHGRVDVQVGTLSKAIGVLGGFIAGPHAADRVAAEPRPALPVLDERARRRSSPRASRRSTSSSDEPERLDAALVEHRGRSRRGCTSSGSIPGTSETPDHAGDHRATRSGRRRSRGRLFEEGVFCPAIVFPPWQGDRARVRTIVTADHTEEDLREALETFERVGAELGLR